MIRVLQVFHGMDCGGAENMIMNLYRKIDKKKIQFDFLVHTEKKAFFDDEIRELGGNIYTVPYYNVINTLSYTKALKAFFSMHPEIRIVHGHLGSCAHIYLNIAQKYGCYTIAHSHNTKPEFSLKNILYKVFTFKTRKIADFFMGCSLAAGNYRFGKKITSDKSRYYTLKNAIDTERFIFNLEDRKEVRRKISIGDEILLGHVGRFNYQKNHDFLIDIFNEVHKKNVNTKLILVGDGELREKVETKINALGLRDFVILTGVRNDVSRLLKGFDCFVFPSYYEGLPVTMIEAQAADLPCVISDVITDEVEMTELVTYVSLQESAEGWAEKVLLATKQNRVNRRDDVIKFGYDIDSTVKWLMEFYLVVDRKKKD